MSGQGADVLLLVDSIARFAAAHREIAFVAGRPPSTRESMARAAEAVAGLCARAAGERHAGSLTAVYIAPSRDDDLDGALTRTLRHVLDGRLPCF